MRGPTFLSRLDKDEFLESGVGLAETGSISMNPHRNPKTSLRTEPRRASVGPLTVHYPTGKANQ